MFQKEIITTLHLTKIERDFKWYIRALEFIEEQVPHVSLDDKSRDSDDDDNTLSIRLTVFQVASKVFTFLNYQVSTPLCLYGIPFNTSFLYPYGQPSSLHCFYTNILIIRALTYCFWHFSYQTGIFFISVILLHQAPLRVTKGLS